MKTYLQLFFTSLLLVQGVSISQAQTEPYPGCPNVQADPTDGSLVLSNDSIYLECGMDCVGLQSDFLETGLTDDYKVESIPFSPPFPFNGGTPMFIGEDDVFSDIIDLPFDFCFYGNSYDQIVIGANGLISFDIGLAGDFCDYVIGGPIPSAPNGIYPLSVNGAFHDINPLECGGSINYSILGSSPCRTFVVNFSDVCLFNPLFSSCGGTKTTQQIVIYETTNAIEVYLKEKPFCTDWQDGEAVLGIQNVDGTKGIAAPGRNLGAWAAYDEAWRFVPDGSPNFEFNWLDENGNSIGTNKNLSYCPTSQVPETVTASIEYTNCNGDKILEEKSLVIIPKVGVDAVIASSDAMCADSCGGSAQITVSQGASPFTIHRADGSTTTDLLLDSLCAGTETITVEEGTGCTMDLTFTVNEPNPITISFTTDKNSCGSAPDGKIQINTISGGTGPYTINWEDGTTDSTFIGAPGEHFVSITDANGCQVDFSETIDAGEEMTIQTTTEDASCFGATDGIAYVVSVTGGATPYTYSWSSGESTDTIYNGAGTYTVTVTAVGGCFVEQDVIIGEPEELILDTTITHLSCPESMDGEIKISVTGGTPDYEYSLNSAAYQASGDFANQDRGPWDVVVRDANGCEATIAGVLTSDSVSVFAPEDFEICQGEPITLTATGFFTQAVWDNGVVDGQEFVPASLGATQFIVSAENASGCEAFDTVGVTVHPVFDATIIPAGPFCTSSGDSQILTNTPDGVWTGAASATGMFSPGGSGAGTHEVIYSFNGACPTADTIYIDVNDNFDAAIHPVEPVCLLADAFDFTSETNGGKWYGNGIVNEDFATFDPELAGAGIHRIFHLVDNECGDYDSLDIEVIDADTAVIMPIADMCPDGDGVTFDASPSGGVWTGEGVRDDGFFDPSDSGPGEYEAGYIPPSTCRISDSARFEVAEPIVVEPDTFYLNCFSDTNGIVVTLPTGGFDGNFAYFWLDSTLNINNGTASDLGRGTYEVVVADGINCSEVIQHQVIAPPGIVHTQATTTTPTMCDNSCDGTAQLFVQGGEDSNGYTYEMEEGQGTPDGSGGFTDLCAGMSVLKVIDGNGCYLLDTVNIASPDAIQYFFTIHPAHCGQMDGSVTMDSIKGGDGNYSYLWSNQSTNSDLTNVLSGNYSLTVTDGNNCSETFSMIIPNEAGPQISLSMSQPTCNGGTDGTAIPVASGGGGGYTFLWSTGATDSILVNVGTGDYWCNVTDVYGCSASETIHIPEPSVVVMNPLADELLCVEQTTTIQLGATGGNGPAYSFISDKGTVVGNELTTADGVDGTYTLQAFDVEGCPSAPITFELNFRDPITLTITPPDTICPGFNKDFEVIAVGGINSYSYSWETGENGSAIKYQTLMDGIRDSISVVVSDGCSPDVEAVTWIDFLEPVVVDVTTIPHQGCEPLFSRFTINNPGLTNIQWFFGDGSPRGEGPIATNNYQKAGDYVPQISFLSAEGCPQSEVLDTVNVYPIPDGVIEMLPNRVDIIFSEAEITLVPDQDSVTGSWLFTTMQGDSVYPGTDLRIDHKFPSIPQVWKLENFIVSKHGCENLVEKAIKVHPNSSVYVPTAFTPDGDGVNDDFHISFSGLEVFGFEVYIYDRWGNAIFHSNDPNFRWDGTKDGEAEPKLDVYAWTIKFYSTEQTRKEMNGSVQVIR